MSGRHLRILRVRNACFTTSGVVVQSQKCFLRDLAGASGMSPHSRLNVNGTVNGLTCLQTPRARRPNACRGSPGSLPMRMEL